MVSTQTFFPSTCASRASRTTKGLKTATTTFKSLDFQKNTPRRNKPQKVSERVTEPGCSSPFNTGNLVSQTEPRSFWKNGSPGAANEKTKINQEERTTTGLLKTIRQVKSKSFGVWKKLLSKFSAKLKTGNKVCLERTDAEKIPLIDQTCLYCNRKRYPIDYNECCPSCKYRFELKRAGLSRKAQVGRLFVYRCTKFRRNLVKDNDEANRKLIARRHAYEKSFFCKDTQNLYSEEASRYSIQSFEPSTISFVPRRVVPIRSSSTTQKYPGLKCNDTPNLLIDAFIQSLPKRERKLSSKSSILRKTTVPKPSQVVIQKKKRQLERRIDYRGRDPEPTNEVFHLYTSNQQIGEETSCPQDIPYSQSATIFDFQISTFSTISKDQEDSNSITNTPITLEKKLGQVCTAVSTVSNEINSIDTTEEQKQCARSDKTDTSTKCENLYPKNPEQSKEEKLENLEQCKDNTDKFLCEDGHSEEVQAANTQQEKFVVEEAKNLQLDSRGSLLESEENKKLTDKHFVEEEDLIILPEPIKESEISLSAQTQKLDSSEINFTEANLVELTQDIDEPNHSSFNVNKCNDEKAGSECYGILNSDSMDPNGPESNITLVTKEDEELSPQVENSAMTEIPASNPVVLSAPVEDKSTDINDECFQKESITKLCPKEILSDIENECSKDIKNESSSTTFPIPLKLAEKCQKARGTTSEKQTCKEVHRDDEAESNSSKFLKQFKILALITEKKNAQCKDVEEKSESIVSSDHDNSSCETTVNSPHTVLQYKSKIASSPLEEVSIEGVEEDKPAIIRCVSNSVEDSENSSLGGDNIADAYTNTPTQVEAVSDDEILSVINESELFALEPCFNELPPTPTKIIEKAAKRKVLDFEKFKIKVMQTEIALEREEFAAKSKELETSLVFTQECTQQFDEDQSKEATLSDFENGIKVKDAEDAEIIEDIKDSKDSQKCLVSACQDKGSISQCDQMQKPEGTLWQLIFMEQVHENESLLEDFKVEKYFTSISNMSKNIPKSQNLIGSANNEEESAFICSSGTAAVTFNNKLNDEVIQHITEFDFEDAPKVIKPYSPGKKASGKSILKWKKNETFQFILAPRRFQLPTTKDERRMLEEKLWGLVETLRDSFAELKGKYDLAELGEILDQFAVVFEFSRANYANFITNEVVNYINWMEEIRHYELDVLGLVKGIAHQYSILLHSIQDSDKSQNSIDEIERHIMNIITSLTNATIIISEIQDSIFLMRQGFQEYTSGLTAYAITTKMTRFEVLDLYQNLCEVHLNPSTDKNQIASYTGHDRYMKDNKFLLEKGDLDYELVFGERLDELQAAHDSLKIAKEDLELNTKTILMNLVNYKNDRERQE